MDGFMASAFAAFFGGALSFLSPCVLPLVPGYLCFAAGLQFSELSALEEKGQATQRILPGALAFVGGFSAVFIALGAGAAAINPLLLAYQTELAYLAGGAIIILGLHVVELVHIPLLAREARLQDNMTVRQSRAPLVAAFIMGLAFAFGWTPCIGPQLGAILSLAASEASIARGTILLAVYALGLGLPFLLVAAFLSKLAATLGWMKRHMQQIERIMGLLLWTIGLLMLTGGFSDLSYWLLERFPALGALG